MNLGKPRRRLTVAERPTIDLDAHFGTDAPAEAETPSERDRAPVANGDHDEATTDRGVGQ
jgi:hypothetical protein